MDPNLAESGTAVVVGIDAGMMNTKAVVLAGSSILSRVSVAAGRESSAILARAALEQALQEARISLPDVQQVVATGKGREHVDVARGKFSEAWCLARGMAFLFPTVRTALDIGGQKCLAVACRQGSPVKTATNDKCAVGSGRYLEMVANILGVRIEEMGKLALNSKASVEVESVCAVFAESEIISLIHLKHQREDIISGVLRGLARRLYPLLVQVGIEKEVAVVGGVARVVALIRALGDLAGCDILVPEQPEMVSALGAALMAQNGRNST